MDIEVRGKNISQQFSREEKLKGPEMAHVETEEKLLLSQDRCVTVNEVPFGYFLD